MVWLHRVECSNGTVIASDFSDPTQLHQLGQPLTAYTDSSPRYAVESLAFSPRGNTMASSGLEGTVIIWDLTGLNDLQAHTTERACSIAGGGLDREEWARYILGLPYRDTCPR